MRRSNQLLRNLRARNRRYGRPDSSAADLRPARRSLPELSREASTPRGLATPRGVGAPISSNSELDPQLRLVGLAIECTTLMHTEVESLVSMLGKLEKVWNTSEARLAVEEKRAQFLKHQLLKRAFADVSCQFVALQELLVIHDEAVQEAIDVLDEQFRSGPRAGRCTE